MSSSRLPGKVLLDIGGQPMLVRVVERTRRAHLLDNVVVATTTDVSDDPVAQLCQERSYPCYRGSLSDVLDRYYQAARTFQADIVVRITGDCPLMDPDVIDQVVRILHRPSTFNLESTPHFTANRLPPPWGRTLPVGLDVEAVTFSALDRAWQEADQPFHREHVMPFFYEGIPKNSLIPGVSTSSFTWHLAQAHSPRGFYVAQLHHDPDYGHYRWTVDTPADLELLRQIYSRFKHSDSFSWYEILSLFEREPELVTINANVQHKTAFHVG